MTDVVELIAKEFTSSRNELEHRKQSRLQPSSVGGDDRVGTAGGLLAASQPVAG